MKLAKLAFFSFSFAILKKLSIIGYKTTPNIWELVRPVNIFILIT